MENTAEEIQALKDRITALEGKITIVRKAKQIVIEKEAGEVKVRVLVLKKLPTGSTEEGWEEPSSEVVNAATALFSTVNLELN
jgi:hypothetical protein